MKEETMRDKEKWMGKLKERLDDYSESLPPLGWERLEKELVPPTGKPFVLRPYRKWGMVAAAVLLIAVFSLSIYLLHAPVAEEMRHVDPLMLASEPDKIPSVPGSDVKVASVEPVKSRSVVARVDKAMEGDGMHDFRKSVDSVVSEVEETSEMVSMEDEKQHVSKDDADTMETTEERVSVTRTNKRSGRDKLHVPSRTTRTKSGRWSVGAVIGNGGGASLANAETGGAVRSAFAEQRLNLASAAGGDIIQIPDNQMVVFKEGVPYLKRTDEIVDVKHHQPVSFGISVRKGFARSFSIETGVTYTLLSSDVQTVADEGGIDQKLHYIGIPVRAGWNFLHKDRFVLYVAAGGMVEKCVYGKLGNDKLRVDPLQFSVSGAVGVQFDATKHVGVYVEPGVAYFFDDGSGVQTIRKERPCNFTLQAGVRFTY